MRTPLSSPCQLGPGGWLSCLRLSHYNPYNTPTKSPGITAENLSAMTIWQMFFENFFENSPYKGNNFLDTYDDDDHIILPTYTKGGGWLNTIGISNSLCTRATRLITNHAPIGEYRARFFPDKTNFCACNNNQLETRHHVLHECPLYRGYNYVGYVLSRIVDFLQTNPCAFCFLDSIEWLVDIAN